MPSVIIPIGPEGAIAEVMVGVSHARAIALQQANRPLPPPVNVRLLVDTGASTSCVETGLLAPLSIRPTGSVPVYSVSSAGTPAMCDQYDVSLIFPTGVPVACGIPTIPITECQPLHGTIQGLIGRDVLNRCVMSYNPHTGHVTLSF